MRRPTISERELEQLLGWRNGDARRQIERGELPVWSLVGPRGERLSPPRIGWRTARKLLRRDVDGARLPLALAELDVMTSGSPRFGADAGNEDASADGPRGRGVGDRERQLEDLRAAASAHGGGSLSFAAYDQIARREGFARAARVAEAFGGWNEAKRAAALPLAPARPRDVVADEELLSGLREAAGGAPSLTISEYDSYARPRGIRVGASVASRFGSWTAAVARAGLEPREPGWQGGRAIGPADR